LTFINAKFFPDRRDFSLERQNIFYDNSDWVLGLGVGMRLSARGTGYRISCHRQSILLAAVGAIFWLVMGSWVATANAVEANVGGDSFASLRDYAQLIAATPATVDSQNSDSDLAKSAQRKSDNDAYAALRSFARGVGADQPQSSKGALKLAEAQTLMELLQGGNGSSAAPPASMPAAKTRSRPAVGATYIGSKACANCHSPLIAQFQKTLMGKIGMSAKGRGKFECENCHGPGSEHVRLGGGRGVGGILSFEQDDPRPVEERNAVCLNCHQRGDRTYWAGGVHETRGLACTNCHTIMKAVSRKYQLKTVRVKDTCFQCHKLQRAQIQYSSHMPIRENKMTCTDCHNPHGSPTEKLLRAASTNQLCYKCHAEKRGPFLFEHQPVRENCLNCHNPHGSNYEYLLKVARPRLCHQCHTMAHNPTTSGGFGYPNTVYLLQNACGNCHSNIHGSNKPNGFFFLR
jgi:DmsE family decaheme c-type cytochrome